VDKKIPFKPQTKEYLSQHQRAVTMVLNQMDGSERKKVEELAQSWNEQGAPPTKFNTSKLVLHHSTFFLGFKYIYLFYFV
jgi:hypothetical protein